MSFNNIIYKTPVAKIRSFFFSVLIVSQIVFSFPITVMAEENSLEDSSPIESYSAVFLQKIYHKHTGSSNGGGCYSIQRTGSRTEEYPCRGSMVYFPEYDKTQCSKCGAGYFGDESGRDCWHSETKTVSYTYYDLGCGKSPSTLLGSVTVTQSTTEWTKSLQLTASYTAENGMAVAECPYIWNGGTASAENILEVNANGNYSLQLNADGNANTAAAIVNIPVKNIDVTAPTVSGHSLLPQEEWTKEGVLVTLGDVHDLQPDGTEGCGLHELPYSFDEGETWVSENSFLYRENGTHTVLVRDVLENVASYNISFSNMDVTPPTVTGLDYDDTKNIRTTVLSVSANDLQTDGSEGCGLHELPYSFDSGTTWTNEPCKQIDVNGSITVAVRDKLENTVYREINITNIDCYAPFLSYEMKHDSWTNEDVKLYLYAQDKNADGSGGIGLADNWYSLDGGKTWNNQAVLVYENNCEIRIFTRDRHDNRSYTDISIRQIDRDAPWVNLQMEVTGEGKDRRVFLTAYADDAYSGLPENAYSWDYGSIYTDKKTIEVNENGYYQVRVKDKAGNWDYDSIEVDTFVEEVIEPIVETEEAPVEEEDTQEQEEEETIQEIPEPVVKKAQKMNEKPKGQVVTVVEENRGLAPWLMAAAVILAVALLMFLLLLLLLGTVVIFAENAKGDMEFVGLQWIHTKEGRYEVRFTELLLEQCVTTHFLLRPGCLFVALHKDAQISCLFPEDICITLSVQKEMDFSLL